MAKIKTKEGEEADLPDGEGMMETCEELGVPIGCSTGTCGVCSIDILEGEDNLSDITDAEKEFEKDKKHRLACQCKIKSGEILIDF